MIVITGQIFKENTFSYSGGKFIKTPYMGRTCIGPQPGYTSCVGEHGPGALDHRPFGTASASTATPQVAWDCRLIMAAVESNLAPSDEVVLLNMIYGGLADTSGYCRIGFSVINDSGTLKLYGGFIESTGGGTTFTDYVELTEITVGGVNFYDVSYLAFSDKVMFFKDGVYVGEVAYSTDYLYAYPFYGDMNIITSQFNWVADYLHYIRHEVNTGTALNRVLTDYVPADGTLYLISAADLADMIDDGDAVELVVANGDIGAEAVADGDWLLVQVLDDNLSTIALKYAKTGGVWAKSNWSIP